MGLGNGIELDIPVNNLKFMALPFALGEKQTNNRFVCWILIDYIDVL